MRFRGAGFSLDGNIFGTIVKIQFGALGSSLRPRLHYLEIERERERERAREKSQLPLQGNIKILKDNFLAFSLCLRYKILKKQVPSIEEFLGGIEWFRDRIKAL